MSDLFDLETPALIVDLERMEANLDRAANYAREQGLALRPHIKTHKSPVVARAQLERGAAGLTCATPLEAEVMREVTDDLLVMYPPVGAMRANRLAHLARNTRLAVALDSEPSLTQLSRAASASGARVRVLVEVDAGMHRVGVATTGAAVALARRVATLPGLEFGGVAFYPGHVRSHVREQDSQIEELRRFVSRLREEFATEKLALPTISAGSTPMLWRTHEVEGVTEMRPGTYVFNDRTTVELGACAPEDCALTVLATVVSTAVPEQAVIDAGSKALGREPLRSGSGASGREGFGALLHDPRIVVSSMSEEHGILDLTGSDWRPAVGDQVRVVPNHVCIAVHLADYVYAMRAETIVSGWPVAARGRGHRPAERTEAKRPLVAGL